MNPYEFDQLVISPIREMERVNRLTKEIDWTNRITHEVQPFEHTACELNPLENIVHEQEALSRRIQELTAPLPEFRLPNVLLPDMAPPVFTPPKITPEDSMRWLNDLRVPVDRMEMHLPDFAFPEGCTLARLRQMSDEDIQAFVDGNPSLIAVQKALHELEMRHIDRATRPHWSVTWTFWFVLISTIIGAIGVIIGAIGVYLMLR